MMAVTEGKVPIGSSSRVLDTTIVVQTDETKAHREGVVIADPEILENRAQVVKTVSGQFVLLAHDPTARSIAGSLVVIVQQNVEIIALLKSIAD